MKNLSLNNISVGKQILLLPLVAFLGLTIVVFFQYASISSHFSFDKANKGRQALYKSIHIFQEQMAQLKLSEKDFFLNKSTEDTRKHQNAVYQMFKTLEQIKSIQQVSPRGQTNADHWHSMLTHYQTVYLETSGKLETIGFSENTGLRGSMRNAIHIVERKIKDKNPSLLRDLLQIRRHEKDYIIRREEKFYEQWKQSIPVFLKNVKNSNLSLVDRVVIELSIPVYTGSFRRLAKLTREHVLDAMLADKISSQLLHDIKSTSAIILSRINIEIDKNNARLRNSFILLLCVTALVTAVAAAFGSLIGYRLRSNLKFLANSMSQLAKGEINIRIPATGFRNEIGTMANALRVFRETEKRKLQAEIELKKSQQHTQNVIESLNESLIEIDAHGVIINANRASEKLWNIHVEKMIGQKLANLFAPTTEEEQKNAVKLCQLSFVQKQLEDMNFTSSVQAGSFVENNAMPSLLVTQNGTISQINTPAAGIFGYTTAELTGQTLEILLPKGIREKHKHHLMSGFKQQTARLLANGRGLSAQHKDGHEVEVSIGLAPLTIAEQPHFLCLLINNRDSLEAGMSDSAIDCLINGINGINGINVDPAVARFATTSSRKQTDDDEIIKADGTRVPVAVSGVLLQGTGKSSPGAIVTAQNITDRKHNEQKILQFKRVIEGSCDQVYMFRPESYKLFYLNDVARHLTGWTADEYFTKTLMDFNPDFNPAEFTSLVKPLISGEKQQVLYERTEARNGAKVEVSVEYIPAGNGTKPYFTATVRDISERKVAEIAKTEFISTVSHELRTPLTSIKGALGIINSGVVGELSDKVGQLVSIALTNSDRLICLINDILDIEKISAGKMDFSLEPMDICDLIHEAIEANEGYAKTHGVTFTSKGVDTKIIVRGDKQRLMQVMSNLMSNAAKFSEKGQDIEISVECKTGKVWVQVKDNGSGIPMAAQATIFDKFTQADSSDQRQKGGTGLGLSIVKMMVEAHGGKIAFKSVEGKGTAFYFDLDLLEQQAEVVPELEQNSANLPALPTLNVGAKLLICEDDKDIAKLLQLMLAQAGYPADIAGSAAKAKRMLIDHQYAGMTLDLNLPDQNGLELLKELRLQKGLENFPIIVVSACLPSKAAQKIDLGFGVIDWMSKPINENRLVALLKQEIGQFPEKNLRILRIEEDDSIHDFVKASIKGKAILEQAKTISIAKRKLSTDPFDLIVLDLELTDGDEADFMTYVSSQLPKPVPVIVFSAGGVPQNTGQNIEAVMVKSKSTSEEFLAVLERVISKNRNPINAT